MNLLRLLDMVATGRPDEVAVQAFDDLLAALDQPAALTPPLEKALVEQHFENR